MPGHQEEVGPQPKRTHRWVFSLQPITERSPAVDGSPGEAASSRRCANARAQRGIRVIREPSTRVEENGTSVPAVDRSETRIIKSRPCS